MTLDQGLAPFHIGFTGPSGSGKTTLIEALVPLLAAGGYRVGVVKHTHHHVVSNKPGKDSWRFDKAGAHRVLLVTPERIYFQHQDGLEPACDPDMLLSGCDIVIHEGGRGLGHPKVLVGETVVEALSRETGGDMIGIVNAAAYDGLPVFDRDARREIACFLVRLFAGERSAERLSPP